MRSSSGLPSRNQTRIEVDLASGPDAPARARRLLERLDGIGKPTLEDARLVVSELVANSVRHAGLRSDDRIRLEVSERPDALRIEVSDPGRGFTSPVAGASPLRAANWGLFLVDRISTEWGVASDGGTKVWCELDRRARRSA